MSKSLKVQVIRKMRPCIEQSNDLEPLSPFRSWLDCTTNTSGYDFRKGQVIADIPRLGADFSE